ncbi:predicted protein [Botrytis cinerea T4]|uniref:Uncharacterized protein n=1 Tax=Botryotinia fuckeliana (strain T4) TaxID=999810 RepID=G2Y4P4_BOTF4|nr:predicted protein [Botrytis cinerea T4]
MIPGILKSINGGCRNPLGNLWIASIEPWKPVSDPSGKMDIADIDRTPKEHTENGAD